MAAGVIVALVVALFVGEVIDQIVKASAPAARRSSDSWIAAVAPIIGESTSLASTLHDIRNVTGLPVCSSTGCQRRTFDAKLGELEKGTRDDLQALDAIGLVPPSQRAGSLMASVLRDRASASGNLAGAVALLLGPSHAHVTSARAQGLLIAVGDELLEADGDYDKFLKSLPKRRSVPQLASSVWVQDPGSWTRTGVQLWADRLEAATGLQSNSSISLIAISTSPPALRITNLPAAPTTTTSPTTTTTSTTTTSTSTTTTLPGAPTTSSTSSTTTSTTTTSTTTTVPVTTTTLQVPPAGSVSVLAPTTHIEIDVIVADAGNVTAAPVSVEASLVPRLSSSSLTSTPVRAHASIPVLTSGEARYLALGPMHIVEGATYVLTVTATVNGTTMASDRVILDIAG